MKNGGIVAIIGAVIAVIIFLVMLPVLTNAVEDTECEVCTETYSVLQEDYILLVLTDDLGANDIYIGYKHISYFTAVTTTVEIIAILNSLTELTTDIATVDILTTGILCYGSVGAYISVNIDTIVNEAQLVSAWNDCLTSGNKQFTINYDSVV